MSEPTWRYHVPSFTESAVDSIEDRATAESTDSVHYIMAEAGQAESEQVIRQRTKEALYVIFPSEMDL